MHAQPRHDDTTTRQQRVSVRRSEWVNVSQSVSGTSKRVKGVGEHFLLGLMMDWVPAGLRKKQPTTFIIDFGSIRIRFGWM